MDTVVFHDIFLFVLLRVRKENSYVCGDLLWVHREKHRVKLRLRKTGRVQLRSL